MPRITKRLVEAAEAQASDYIICDDELKGLAVRVLPSGRRAYIVQYWKGKRYRRMSLGLHGVLTTEKARRMAFGLLAAVKEGQEPAGDRREARTAVTVAELAERFDKEHIAVRLKPGTAREYRRNLRRFILPAIGKLRVADVTRADIARFHHHLRHIPYQANRNLEVISKMFQLAELWGLRPDGSNPRRHIKKYPEEKRERYLSPTELAALGEALWLAEQEGVEDSFAIAAIRLLIFTGCRLNEIMTLKWAHVDVAARWLRLPDTKTGARLVHLGGPALEVLRNIERRPDNPWVICGKILGARRTDLQPPWQRMRKRATVRLWVRSDGTPEAGLVSSLEARLGREPTHDECLAAAKRRRVDLSTGLVDVRIHDLWHSFASGAVTLGESLRVSSVFLGATVRDTDHDQAPYRRLVRDCLEKGNVAVFPQNHWVLPFADVVKECCRRIGELSGYLGLFGFRYGWRPTPGGPSITELEFDAAWTRWRHLSHPPIFVFVPARGSEAAKELEAAAEHVLAEEFPEEAGRVRSKDDQAKFVGRISGMGRIVLAFANRIDLAQRAAVAVPLYNAELLSLDRHQEIRSLIPSPDLGRLGREGQLRAVRQLLVALAQNSPAMVWWCTAGRGMGNRSFSIIWSNGLVGVRPPDPSWVETTMNSTAFLAGWRESSVGLTSMSVSMPWPIRYPSSASASPPRPGRRPRPNKLLLHQPVGHNRETCTYGSEGAGPAARPARLPNPVVKPSTAPFQ